MDDGSRDRYLERLIERSEDLQRRSRRLRDAGTVLSAQIAYLMHTGAASAGRAGFDRARTIPGRRIPDGHDA